MRTIFTFHCGWRICFNFSTHCFARVKGTFWMCANACRPKRDRTGETQKVNESNASLENATPSTRTRMLETKRYWAPTVLFFQSMPGNPSQRLCESLASLLFKLQWPFARPFLHTSVGRFGIMPSKILLSLCSQASICEDSLKNTFQHAHKGFNMPPIKHKNQLSPNLPHWCYEDLSIPQSKLYLYNAPNAPCNTQQ